MDVEFLLKEHILRGLGVATFLELLGAVLLQLES